MTRPVEIDSITFNDAFDFEAFARDVLAGSSGVGALPDDPLPVAWLLRAYPRLHGTSYADLLSAAVAQCLVDSDPATRGQALLFFEKNPTARGADEIVRLASGGGRLFEGVADPEHPSVDLEWQLLTTLGSLVRSGNAAAIRIARTIVLKSSKANPIIGSLSKADPEWWSRTPNRSSEQLRRLLRRWSSISSWRAAMSPMWASGSPRSSCTIRGSART